MSDNPFQMPDSNREPEVPDPEGFHAPVACPAGQGILWFSQGWQLFAGSPWMLSFLALVLFICVFVVSLIPLLGFIAIILFWPHLMAGLYLALEHADRGAPVTLGDLFRPFRDPGNLVGIGALLFGAQILIMLVSMVFVFGGVGMNGLMSAMNHPQVVGMQMHMAAGGFIWSLVGGLVSLALSIPLGMAMLFSPLLSYRYGLPPLEAMKLSFMGCWTNFLSLFVWSLIWLVAGIALTLLFFLPFVGWLIAVVVAFTVFPLSLANLYCAWKDIYVR